MLGGVIEGARAGFGTLFAINATFTRELPISRRVWPCKRAKMPGFRADRA
jgi:hypothetical protein